MVTIPVLIEVLTAPGVVVHEFAHKQACEFFRVPVDKTVYFQFDDPAGYVEHATPRSYLASIMIAIAPLLVNTLLSVFVSVLLSLNFLYNNGSASLSVSLPVMLFMAFGLWLSVSFGTHVLPSSSDADVLWSSSKRRWYNPLVVIGIPLVLLIKLVNVVSNAYTRLVVGLVITGVGVYAGTHPSVFYPVWEFLI